MIAPVGRPRRDMWTIESIHDNCPNPIGTPYNSADGRALETAHGWCLHRHLDLSVETIFTAVAEPHARVAKLAAPQVGR